MTRKTVIWIFTVAVVFATATFYALTDPSTSNWMPQCVFLKLTGFKCPGCGAQRTLHALLNGQFNQLFSYNPLLFFIVPVALSIALVENNRQKYPRLHKALTSTTLWIATVVIVILWTVVRNIFDW